MNFLRSVVSELIGLFVDDWLFALLLVIWVSLAVEFSPRLPPTVTAPVLFLGLAVLTLVFAIRQALRLLRSSQKK